MKWGFYGRSKELNEIEMSQKNPSFESYLMLGRRKVGKTQLLKTALESKPEPKPVFFTMPQEEHTTAHDAVQMFEETIRETGYELPPPGLHHDNPKIRFDRLIRWVIEKNVNTVIDEFHHVDRVGLVSPVHSAVSHLRGERMRDPSLASGKLYLCGSHEQLMMDLFMPHETLHNSVSRYHIRPRPWKIAEVLEMAVNQGLLRNPCRFLTMYSAFGGMPGAWENFVAKGRHAELDLKHPYGTGSRKDFLRNHVSWTADLIKEEMDLIQKDADSRWDSQNYVYLTDDDREILNYIAEFPGGRSTKQIADRIGFRMEDFSEKTFTLDRRLEIIGTRQRYHGRKNDHDTVWTITDPVAAFQRKILDNVKHDGNDSEAWSDGEKQSVALRMASRMEGFFLERMAAEWLDMQPDTFRSRHGAWVPGEVPDIDLFGYAKKENENPHAMILGSCKRNPYQHPTGEFSETCDMFFKAGHMEETIRWKAHWKTYDRRKEWDKEPHLEPRDTPSYIRKESVLPRRQLLVSPHFPDEVRSKAEAQGFECVGFTDMARSFGLTPDPAPERAAQSVSEEPDGNGFSP